MSEKRRITAEDLYAFRLPSDPQLSPDGQRVIFCLQQVERKTEKKITNLWLVPADGSRPPRPFTHGKQRDTHPRWSPDGRQIAFLSNRADEKQAQIYLIPIDGGEGRPLTELSGTIGGFEWSPDGRRLVCQFRKKDAAVVEREQDEQKKKLGVVDRRITSLDYRFDGAGYLPAEKWHVWTIDAETGAAAQLTDGDYDELAPRWSPDGQQILCVSNRHERPDLTHDATELYLLPADGGELQRVAAPYGRKYAAAFSPDGRHISYVGRKQVGKWYQNGDVFVVRRDGSAARNLTADADIHFGSMTGGDVMGSPPMVSPTWLPDGRSLLAMSTVRGSQPLQRLAVAAEAAAAPAEVTAVLGAADAANPSIVGPFSLSADGQRMAFWGASLADPGQIWLHDFGSGETTQLTTFNAELLESLHLGDIEELWFDGPDGNALHGWVMTPPDFDAAKQYPAILEIHGGPQTQYGRNFFFEFHFLAASDYVVYWSNPRGSIGYGEAHTGAIYGRWGTVDYADVMAWVDEVVKRPYVDVDRLGVTGGSYGGYMTTLIIGKSDRFKAAVAQRVVSNAISFYGSSDLNWGAEYLMGIEAPPWQAFDAYWEISPMKHIGSAATPTLIMHSEQDLRCDKEQGEQVFVALRRMGVDTELILFPEESHDLSRGGRTDRRIARLTHMRRWFDTYLK